MIHPPARLGLVVWLLGFCCAGCSGTPLGEQLAERLSEPEDPVAQTTPQRSSAAEPTGEPLTEPPSEPGDPEGEDPPDPSAPAPTAPTAPEEDVPAPPPPPHLLNPTPYRLLLRLPAADPAAPAEAVTRALRAAGILFEVETIERLPRSSTPAPPNPVEPSP